MPQVRSTCQGGSSCAGSRRGLRRHRPGRPGGEQAHSPSCSRRPAVLRPHCPARGTRHSHGAHGARPPCALASTLLLRLRGSSPTRAPQTKHLGGAQSRCPPPPEAQWPLVSQLRSPRARPLGLSSRVQGRLCGTAAGARAARLRFGSPPTQRQRAGEGSGRAAAWKPQDSPGPSSKPHGGNGPILQPKPARGGDLRIQAALVTSRTHCPCPRPGAGPRWLA